MSDKESITLKWGTLKGWYLKSDAALDAVRRYFGDKVTVGAAQQHDTPEQKQAICDMIDAIDGEIYDDWNGGTMTKEAAKKYVMEYGKKSAA